MAIPTLDQIIERVAVEPNQNFGALTAQLVAEGASLDDLFSSAVGMAYAMILSVLKRYPPEVQKDLAEAHLDYLKASVMLWFEIEGRA